MTNYTLTLSESLATLFCSDTASSYNDSAVVFIARVGIALSDADFFTTCLASGLVLVVSVDRFFSVPVLVVAVSSSLSDAGSCLI